MCLFFPGRWCECLEQQKLCHSCVNTIFIFSLMLPTVVIIVSILSLGCDLVERHLQKFSGKSTELRQNLLFLCFFSVFFWKDWPFVITRGVNFLFFLLIGSYPRNYLFSYHTWIIWNYRKKQMRRSEPIFLGLWLYFWFVLMQIQIFTQIKEKESADFNFKY